MRINLNKFKKLHEDDHKAILQHPAGHYFTLAKGALSKENHEELAKVPMVKMADGGGVESEEAQASLPDDQGQQPQVMDPDQPVMNIAEGKAPEEGIVPPAPQQNYSAMPASAPMQPTAQPADHSDPFGQKQYLSDVNAAYGLQGRSLYGEAEAQQNLGAQQAKTYGSLETQLSHLNDLTQQNVQKFQSDQDQFKKEYLDQKIDPNRYVNNLGTWGKVRMAIGLMLGGLSAGVNHTNNQALEMLNNSINNDIAAQQSELGKKKSLFEYNLQKYQNTNQAMQATRANMLGLAELELKKQGAQNAGTMAGYKADSAAGQLGLQIADLHQNIARQQAVFQGTRNGQVDPSIAISMLAKTPQEAEAAGKELTAVKNHASQTQNILAEFRKAAQENTLTGRLGRAGFAPPSVGNMQSLMMPYLKDAEGRINEQELQRTDKLIPSPADKDDTVQQKYQGLLKFLQEKSPHPVLLQRYGINPNSLGVSENQTPIRLGPPKL